MLLADGNRPLLKTGEEEASINRGFIVAQRPRIIAYLLVFVSDRPTKPNELVHIEIELVLLHLTENPR